MKNIAFTICAKNYIGLAQVLEKSILKHNKEIEFYIFIADELSDREKELYLSDNIIIARDVLNISSDLWDEMSFKYDLTEFCTSIKPFCFSYIFNNLSASKCLYFDPDILVFNSISSIYSTLDNYSIIVTPHITDMEVIYTGSLNERNLLYSGMYNLGFLGLKKDLNSIKMLKWWEKRLEDRCFRIMTENYFTDQKWIDFLPSFFKNELCISFDLGFNLAPWNFHEREVIEINNSLYVQYRNRLKTSEQYPLVFLHYSGFNYGLLLEGKISQNNIDNLPIYSDIAVLFNEYSKYLNNSEFGKYISLKYTYNYFENGEYISPVYRRLYRSLIENKNVILNPFNINNTFYRNLKSNGLISNKMIESDKTNIKSTKNVNQKISIINKILKLIFIIIGQKNYFILVRLMRIYSIIENHTFLLNKEISKIYKIRN